MFLYPHSVRHSVIWLLFFSWVKYMDWIKCSLSTPTIGSLHVRAQRHGLWSECCYPIQPWVGAYDRRWSLQGGLHRVSLLGMELVPDRKRPQRTDVTAKHLRTLGHWNLINGTPMVDGGS